MQFRIGGSAAERTVMQYIIDTANLELIRECFEYYPIEGVTTNPTIISRENTDYCALLKAIRGIIGNDAQLHVQVTADTAEGMVKEALMLKELVGGNFFAKIPVGAQGLKATSELARQGVKVTETAIFTQQQALIAAKAGASYVAPYVNRLDNVLGDGVKVVEEIVKIFNNFSINTKVLAASFKNVEEIHKVALAGGHAVTINPDMFYHLVNHPLTDAAVDNFNRDWESVYGSRKVADLLGK